MYCHIQNIRYGKTEDRDMNKKTNYILRLMLGMYLAFIGVNLIRETLAAHPSDLAFKLFMGIIFVIIGAGYTIWVIKRMVSSKKQSKRSKNVRKLLRLHCKKWNSADNAYSHKAALHQCHHRLN